MPNISEACAKLLSEIVVARCHHIAVHRVSPRKKDVQTPHLTVVAML